MGLLRGVAAVTMTIAFVGCTGGMRLGSISESDIEAAYKKRDEAMLFDTCQQGVHGLLKKNGQRGEADALACDRYGQLQLVKLAAAIDKKDQALIKQVCKKSSSLDVHPKTGKALTRGYNAGRYPDEAPAVLKPIIAYQCRNLKRCSLSLGEIACAVQKRSKADDAESAMTAAVATCDPEVVDKAFTKAFGDTYGSNQAQQRWFVKSNVALMKCGPKQEQWVFERRLHWGKKYGEALADALAAAGVDLEAVIKRHLEAHPSDAFNFKNSGWAAGEAARWMRRNKRFEACDVLVAAYPKMTPGAQFAWLWYFKDATCKKARPFAEALLPHAQKNVRIQACKVLSVLGTKRSIRKIKGLATSDPFWRWNRRVRVYPVREACQMAINAIKTR